MQISQNESDLNTFFFLRNFLGLARGFRGVVLGSA
jgi:hypothetical protein